MISLLARLFLKTDNRTEAELRKSCGVLCGAAGVGLNLLLFLGKLLAGLAAGSIAAVADAVNNLSDAGSSLVTLVGFLLAGQKPDHHHPFGHGRAEYLSGLAVSMLILLMGFELAKSSAARIVHPAPLAEGGPLLLILCASIGVKLYMAFYNRKLGRKFNSPAMEAAAVDSLSDCAATAVVLLSALLGRYMSWPVDGWGGLLVAVFILWSGFRSAKATINPLLGTPPSPDFVTSIRELALAHPAILGVHDLIVHDYGPGRRMISLHAEVSAKENVLELHAAVDRLERELRDRLGCETVIHMDPIVVDDPAAAELRRRVEELVRCIDDEIGIHDFRMIRSGDRADLVFDAVVPFGFRLGDREVEKKIQSAVQVLDSGCRAVVNVERSYT